MDSRTVDSLVSAARAQTDGFELYVRDADGLSARYDKGRFQIFEREAFRGASIRAVKSGKVGFSTTTTPDTALIDAAVALAPYGSPYDFSFAPAAKADHGDITDPGVAGVSAAQLAELGTFATGLMRELAPDASFSGAFGNSTGNARVVTSAGQDAVRRSTMFSYYVAAECNTEGDFLSVYKGRTTNRVLGAKDVEASVREVAADYQASKKAAPVTAGSYRVLFTPTCLRDVLSPIGAGVNGVNIEKKTSRWVESLGQRVFDERITVTDDPAHTDGCGSAAFDGEGVPAKRRAIIERGVLRGFLHSRTTAAHTAQEPTGNGQRGVESIPRPGFHNFVMDAGDVPLATMMRDLGDGLVIDSLIGAFTSNFLAGQCSGGIALGWLVKDGQRVGRVKNCAINVNLFELFNGHLVALSREREWRGTSLLPSALVDGVAVSAR